jgi:glucose/mannose-6-phosphate isomerase
MDNFRQAILKFNKQLTSAALQFSNLEKLSGLKTDVVIILGMGGSGQIGDLIAGLAAELKIPVPIIVWKNYGLPQITFKKPFYLFISFSGNTEETLSGFNAKFRNFDISKHRAVVCSDGQLKRLAEETKTPLATFCGDNLVPRQASGLMFYGAMKILKTIFKAIQLPEFTSLKPSTLENQGKKIARLLTKKTILLYTTNNNNHLAYHWKTRLNETAKHLAFSGSLPEMSHNEIVPFETRPQNIFAIFLIDSLDFSRNQKKINLISQLFKKYGIRHLKINLQGKTRLEKTWNSLILADWVSYYLAKIKKVKPESTKLIDQLKKLMAK